MVIDKQTFQISDSRDHILQGGILLAAHKFKIAWGIIRAIAVTMMNVLPSFERAIKRFGNYKAVLINFATLVSHGMVYSKEKFDIAVRSGFSLERANSVFFSPRESIMAFLTNTRVSFTTKFKANLVEPIEPFLATLTTSDGNHAPHCPARIALVYFFRKENRRSDRENKIDLRFCGPWFHGYNMPQAIEQYNPCCSVGG
jgi:hypothetical protein